MVVAGLTACVPPLGSNVYALPSLPATVTRVAFMAVTVNVDAPPELIEAGLAEIVTVGGGFGVTVTAVLADIFPPAPVASAV